MGLEANTADPHSLLSIKKPIWEQRSEDELERARGSSPHCPAGVIIGVVGHIGVSGKAVKQKVIQRVCV